MTSTNVDVDVDLDPRPRLRCRAPSRLAAQDRPTSNVDGGFNVVRRRPPRRSGSTIRSTSTIANARSKTRDESSEPAVGGAARSLARDACADHPPARGRRLPRTAACPGFPLPFPVLRPRFEPHRPVGPPPPPHPASSSLAIFHVSQHFPARAATLRSSPARRRPALITGPPPPCARRPTRSCVSLPALDLRLPPGHRACAPPDLLPV
jgi:hypothetical protein